MRHLRFFQPALRRATRPFATDARPAAHVDSVVVGGGPAGLAAVGSLLAQRPGQPLLWVDPAFAAGRVGAHYREVPSNTKVALFLQYAHACAPLRAAAERVAAAPGDNALRRLAELPQDRGCDLGYAADMVTELSAMLPQTSPEVWQARGHVASASLDRATGHWTVTTVDSTFKSTESSVTASRVILCTGAHPVVHVLPGQPADLVTLDLDTALTPSALAAALPTTTRVTVGVVGASHSAVLALMNLVALATSTHRQLSVTWFSRHASLRYAEYMDGWILRDNTGLKGQAADWARAHLEPAAFATSPVRQVVRRVLTSGGPDEEASVYTAELPGCTHLVQAVGYRANTLPRLLDISAPGAAPASLAVRHDSSTGRFVFAEGAEGASDVASRVVPGLFGAGIAFPQRVTDPHGNVEHAVGFWKFARFLNEVVPTWVGQK